MQMSLEHAKQLVLKHALVSCDASDPNPDDGFLRSLKNEAGLNDENFHEVMASVSVLAPTFSVSGNGSDPEIMAALWRIVTLGREWGLATDSSITLRDARILEDWINKIAWAVTMFLDGHDSSVAFRDYSAPDNTLGTGIEAESPEDDRSETNTDPTDDEETNTTPRCMHLWSNGLFMNAGLPEGEEVIGDGDFWCSLTQTILGPDGGFCDGDECRESSRSCYEVS